MRPEPAFPIGDVYVEICPDDAAVASLELRTIEYHLSTGCLLADTPRPARPLPVTA